MRVAAPTFGPVPLVAVRLLVAVACLLPLVAAAGRLGELRAHAGALLLLGVVNSALPFSLIAYSTLSLTAGFASVLNATTPLFAAGLARLWLKETLSGT